MVLMENIHVFNCRSEFTSAFKVPISGNYILVIGVFIAQGLHILSMHIPFMQQILGIEPISFFEWGVVFALALLLLLVMESYKLIIRRMAVSARAR